MSFLLPTTQAHDEFRCVLPFVQADLVNNLGTIARLVERPNWTWHGRMGNASHLRDLS